MLVISSPLPAIGNEVEIASFGKAKTVQEYVTEYYENVPVMAEIARCESQFRHYDSDGDIIRGKVNNLDVGVMQINEYYHIDTADRLNIDLHTLDGNLEYALSLYNREGTQPWSASKKCWGGNLLALK